jgi:MoaA/NifB/PqqE/SkfB family radical SAM enzyme
MVKGIRFSEFASTNPRAVLKLLEVKGLGPYASSYCYNYPSALQIEVTNNCNLRCKTCPRLEELDAKGGGIKDMDFASYKRILDDMKDLFWLYLCGRGEPLLNRDIFRMVDYAVNKGIPAVLVATNATLLKGETLERLVEARPKALAVSIDGPDKESFRAVRTIDLDTVLSNISAFASRTDIPVAITTVLNKANLHNITDMPALCRRVGAAYFRVLSMVEYDAGGVQSIRLHEFSPEQYARLYRDLKKRCRREGVELIMQKRLRDRQCLTPFNFANIDVDGNLTVCCTLPEIVIGNVLEEGFFPLWNSKKMKAWRTMLLTGNYPKKCVEINCFRIDPPATGLLFGAARLLRRKGHGT